MSTGQQQPASNNLIKRRSCDEVWTICETQKKIFVGFFAICSNICVLQALLSAQQPPLPTSPRKKSARTEVVLISDESFAIKKAFNEIAFDICRFSSNYSLLNIYAYILRIRHQPQLMTWHQTPVPKVLQRWMKLCVLTKVSLSNKSKKFRICFHTFFF